MVRLIISLFFFLLSLLTIFPAPTNLLWYVAILVGEAPWIFLLIQVSLLLWGYKTEQFGAAGTLVVLVSSALFLVPVVTAWRLSSQVQADIKNNFHSGLEKERTPFSPMRMFQSFSVGSYPFRTVAYKEGDNSLKLDFYSSAIGGKRPCVVVVHGGSWAGGNSRQLPELNAHLARKGYHVAAINYRLAPAHVFPAQLEDLRSALNYLKQEAAVLDIDPANFVLLGRSAGGQLVLSAAYEQKIEGVKGVIAFYGPADLVWGAQNPANPWVFNSNLVLENFIGGSFPKIPERYAAASPVLQVNASTPPTLLLHGKLDVLVAYEHSIRLQKALKENGIPHYLLTLPWATHGFDYLLSGPGGQLSTFCVEEFLGSVTSR